MSPMRFDSTQKRVLNTLISGTCFVFREKTLALAKLVLPFLPFGKAIAVASMLVEKFPTTHATKPFYATARPRWRRTFVFRLNPYCPLSKLFAYKGTRERWVSCGRATGHMDASAKIAGNKSEQ